MLKKQLRLVQPVKSLFSAKNSYNFTRYYGNLFNFDLKLNKTIKKNMLDEYVEHFRKYGHHFASLDPLNLNSKYFFILI